MWDSPQDPIINLEHVTWAEQLINASDAALLHFCGEYMHGGQTQADAQRIKKLMTRALAGEFSAQKPHEKTLLTKNVAPYSLVMRASKLDKRRFEEAVDHLAALSDIEQINVDTNHPNGRKEKQRALCFKV